MDNLKIGELFAKLKPRFIDLIGIIGGGTGPFAPTPHDLNSAHHSGTIADAQATQFLKTDGSRLLTGNQVVADGVTIDGVDISAHAASINAHHEPVTILDTATIDFGLSGQQVTGSVKQAGIDHGSISGLNDDDHTQYFNSTRHTLALHTGLGLVANTRQVISGNGLSGGGDLSADRTLAVGAGTGISVAADAVAIDLTANLTWTGSHIFQGGLSTRHLLPELTDTYDLGSSSLLWRKGWLSELDTVLFAKNTMTLLGGWFTVGKGEGALPADVGSADTSIDFGQAMTPGHFVVFRSSLQVEYVTVGSLVSGTTYNVTRNVDGSGANAWVSGSVFLILGTTGDGRIELNAYDTPRISILEQGATYNAQTERIRIGDLAAWQGAGFTGYGIAIGNYAGNEYLAYSPAGGLVVRGTIRADDGFLGTLDVAGKLSISGVSGALTIGATPPSSSVSGTGLWIDRTGFYSLKSNVYQVKIDATDGKLYAGNGAVILDEDGISLKNKTTDGTKEAAASLKFYDNPGSLLGELAFWYGVGGHQWQLGEITRYPGTGIPSFIGIDNNVKIDGNLDMLSPHGISTYGLTLTTDYTFRQTRTDGSIIPLLPCPPWVAAKSFSFIRSSYNPLQHPSGLVYDESYLARHLTPNTGSGSVIALNKKETISDYLLYYRSNGAYYYSNAAQGQVLNGSVNLNILLWFKPTSNNILQGLFQFGTTTPNCLAYISNLNKIIFEVYDAAGIGQIISSNDIVKDSWNYISLAQRASVSYINLNGTTTSASLGKGVFRAAVGDFRLGHTPYAGYFSGVLGWFFSSYAQSAMSMDMMIDMSRPWHGH